MSRNDQETHPRVFISYSHDSPEHADKVLKFANKLRSQGIDATLDQYEPWPEKGWAQWMLQQVSEADFVLMICTEIYYKGVMDRLAPGEKRGVKYEWNLINNHFYKAGTVNKRFLPVLLEKTCVEWIPDPFQAVPWFCIVTDEGYEDLYRRLTNQPKTKRPKLDKLKSLEVREVKINFLAEGDSGEGVQDAGGDVRDASGDGGEGVRDAGEADGGSGNGGREEGRRGNVTTKGQFIFGAIVTIAIITSVAWEIMKYYSPDLHVTVDCEHWDAPLDVRNELNKETNRVSQIHTMHTVNIHNRGDRKCNSVVLLCKDDNSKFKYIEYKKKYEDKTTGKRDCKSITFTNLMGSETASAKAWMTCEVCRSPAIDVLQDPGASPHIYVRTPVNVLAKLVNKYAATSIVLAALVCFLATPTIKNLLRRLKSLLRTITIRDLIRWIKDLRTIMGS